MKTFTEVAPMVRHALNGPTMGTRYGAVFFVPDGMATEALAVALFDAVDRVDRQMSTWKPESDINRLNAAPVGEWVTIPRELMTVLAEALKIGVATNGAFDIGLGALVSAWGFGPGPRQPDQSRITAASELPRAATTAALQLDVSASCARKTAPLGLDLSGIAKGFGVDEMARIMDASGIRSWLVGIDGEMRARGLKPEGTPWAVAHERPDRYRREAMGVIELTDMAVATSGNYRHWVELDGKLLSHTMDPGTHRPVANRITSVSVLAPTCMVADAYATAFMVLGAEAARKLAADMGFGTIFVFDDGTVRSTI